MLFQSKVCFYLAITENDLITAIQHSQCYHHNCNTITTITFFSHHHWTTNARVTNVSRTELSATITSAVLYWWSLLKSNTCLTLVSFTQGLAPSSKRIGHRSSDGNIKNTLVVVDSNVCTSVASYARILWPHGE